MWYELLRCEFIAVVSITVTVFIDKSLKSDRNLRQLTEAQAHLFKTLLHLRSR